MKKSNMVSRPIRAMTGREVLEDLKRRYGNKPIVVVPMFDKDKIIESPK